MTIDFDDRKKIVQEKNATERRVYGLISAQRNRHARPG